VRVFPRRYPAAKTTKLRARQHPWARVARRFSRAASKRLSEDPPDEQPSERVWDIVRTTEEVVAELKRGNEADADTTLYVVLLDLLRYVPLGTCWNTYQICRLKKGVVVP
jgi:hypothetical protein